MRIAIDMQGAQANSIQQEVSSHTISLTKSLLKRYGEQHEFLLLFNGSLEGGRESCLDALRDIANPWQCHSWYAPPFFHASNTNNSERRRIARIIYNNFVCSLEVDILLITSLFEGFHDDAYTIPSERLSKSACITCILHDLIPLELPQEFLTEPTYRAHYFECIEALKSAIGLFPVSQYTADCYTSFFTREAAAQTISVIAREGSFSDELPEDKYRGSSQVRQLQGKKYLLYVADYDEQVNTAGLMSSLAHLDENVAANFRLVICGTGHDHNWMRSQFTCHGLPAESFLLLTECSKEELASLYSGCVAYIHPFISNSTVTPIIQAVSRGAACIAPRSGAISEIVGDDRALFNPCDPSDIASLISRVWLNEEFRDSVHESQSQHISQLGWKMVAETAMNGLLHCHSKWLSQTTRPTQRPHEWGDATAHELRIGLQMSAKELIELSNCLAQTFPSATRKKVLFVDVSQLTKQDFRTGIQRVVRSILSNIEENLPEGWAIVAVYGEQSRPGYFVEGKISRAILSSPDANNSEEGKPAYFTNGDVLLILDLQHHVALYQRPFLKALRSHGVSIYFTIYDILPIVFPQFFQNSERLRSIHSEWLSLISQMDGYLAISAAVKDEVSAWMKDNCDTLPPHYHHGYFHLGADLEASIPSSGLTDNAEEILALLRSRQTFLQVSTLEPRKGPTQLLDAFDQLWERGLEVNLVFVGKKGWLVEELVARIKSHPLLGNKLFWLQGVSDEMLEQVYIASTCCIMASYGEGFGLPIVEAAQKGLPIIARDIPVFREVASTSAYYFDETTPEGLADRIANWLDLYSRGKHPTSTGMPYISWATSAKQLVDSLEKAMNRQLPQTMSQN